MTNPRWKRRPHGSTWGDFGPDDELGRLNLLTPEKVRQGVAEVREGLTFCLSLPLECPGGNVLNPRRHPPVIRPTLRGARPNFNFRLCEEIPDATDVICDDLVVLHLQYSTQWDSLAHVGQLFDVDGDGRPKAVYYNGFRADEDVVGPAEGEDAGVPHGPSRTSSQAKRLGVHRMAETCLQGRGVMMDLHAHLGREPAAIGYDRLMRVIEADKVEVETGDMVCLHTGFAALLLEQGGALEPNIVSNACAALDGRDRKLLNWITDSGLCCLIADNYAVEIHPARPGEGCCATLPLHEHCLFKLGVNLGELWHLTPLAEWLRAKGRYRFLLTAPPLRLTGAVGSPATPVATV
jgi:hypothetical protein